MTNTITKKAAIVLATMLTIFISSCKKDNVEEPATVNPPAPPAAAVNNLASQQWSLDDRTFNADNPLQLDWSRSTGGSYGIEATRGSNQDSLFNCGVYFGTWNMPSGTFAISPNAATLANNVIAPGAAKFIANPYNYLYYNYISGGNAIITNTATEFDIKINDAQLSTKKLNAHFTIPKATIPSANAGFTPPTGVIANKLLLDSTTSSSLVPFSAQLNWKAGTISALESLNSQTRAINIYFNRSMPPSGTYDIVPLGATKPAPGKVVFEYINFQNNAVYISTNGGTATVVNTNGVVSVNIQNVSMALRLPSGAFGSTIRVSGNITY